MKNAYETKDKNLVPFLLISPGVVFVGTRKDREIVYFQFSPQEKCLKLVNSFLSKRAPLVQPKDLLDAVEAFRDRIFEERRKEQVR